MKWVRGWDQQVTRDDAIADFGNKRKYDAYNETDAFLIDEVGAWF